MEVKKGQGATEFLIVIAIALIVLVTFIAVNTDVFFSSEKQIRYQKARIAVDEVATAAEVVYQQGVGSRTKVYVQLPNGIETAAISNNTVYIKFEGTSTKVYRSFPFNVNGTIPINEGFYWICVQSLENNVFAADCNEFNISTNQTQPIDNIPPIVILEYPSDNSNFSYSNINFNCSATDDVSLQSIELWGNFTGVWSQNDSCLVSGLSDSCLWNINLANGNYIWNCRASDTSSNIDWGNDNYSLLINSITDNDFPRIDLINPSITTYNGTPIYFYYNVSDITSAISSCSLIINESINATVLSPIENVILNFSIIEGLSVGSYSWQINCTDTAGNENSSILGSVLVSEPMDNYPEVIYSDWEWPYVVKVLNGNNGSLKFRTTTFGSPPSNDRVIAVGDLNGNNINDIIIGVNNWEYVFAFYGENGSQMWSYTMSESSDDLRSNIEIYNGNVFFGGDQNKLYKINGSDGTEVWKSTDYANSNIEKIALGDFNGDSYIDIVVNDEGKNEVYAYNGQNGNTLWTLSMSSSANGDSDIKIGEATGDNYDDVFIGTNKDRVYLINGNTGLEVWTSTDIGPDVDYVGVGDFNNDNYADVVAMNDWEEYIYAFYGTNGSTYWSYLSDWENGYMLESADLNNDNYDDVIFGNTDNTRYDAIYGNNGSLIYSSASFGDDILYIDIGDLNLDNYNEIVTGSWGSLIRAYYGINGSIFWSYTSASDLISNLIIKQVGE